jgi:anti-sigma regulatory factor (Ser/Thr protein kinase)
VCQVAREVDVPLALDAASVGAARRVVRDAVCTVHGAELVDACLLLASELVANAVRHGAAPVRLVVRCDEARGAEIRVSDGSARAPVVRGADLDALGGRGMLLVELLSDAWGSTPTRAGKVVWCRLRRDAGRRAAS